MNVWLIQPGEPLPISGNERKMRTALLADKLVERGHNLLWWASAYEHQRKVWLSDQDQSFEIVPNYTIRVLRGTGYKKNISLFRYIDHLIVAFKFKHQAEKFKKPDIIVASMPCYHLAFEAIRYARRFKIPTVVDIRDLWPDIFLESLGDSWQYRIGKVLLTRDYIKLTFLLRQADSLIAISGGCLDWGLDKIGRSQRSLDRVFYHGYKMEKNASLNLGSRNQSTIGENKLFLFVGTFGKSYELELIADAARRFMREENTDISFCIAGTGEKYESLKSKTADLNNLTLPGWIEAREIRVLLNKSWAGIVPCKSIVNAAPNKVFEYLSAGLPLISSLEGEIADLIQRHRIGLNYKAGNSEGLYQCIKKLSDDEKLRNDMAQAASQFFDKCGNADRIYEEYATHIEKLVDQKRLLRASEK